MSNIDIINQQLGQIISDIKYEGYFVRAYEERMFEELKDGLDSKGIYIVVRFGAPTNNFGQKYVNMTMTAMSEQNAFDIALMLLDEYAGTYNNYVDTTNGYIKQFYTGANILQNFAEIDAGFRALIAVNGAWLVSSDLNPITSIVYYATAEAETGETLKFIYSSDDYSVQLNPVANYNALGEARSTGATATYVLTFTAYATNTPLANKVLDQKLGTLGVNPDYYFTITYLNGKKLTKGKFKLANTTTEENMGSLPVSAFVFTKGK